MLATRKDVPFQVITSTLVAIAFASGIATAVPEQVEQSRTTSGPTPYSADHARITNYEAPAPTF